MALAVGCCNDFERRLDGGADPDPGAGVGDGAQHGAVDDGVLRACRVGREGLGRGKRCEQVARAGEEAAGGYAGVEGGVHRLFGLLDPAKLSHGHRLDEPGFGVGWILGEPGVGKLDRPLGVAVEDLEKLPLPAALVVQVRRAFVEHAAAPLVLGCRSRGAASRLRRRRAGRTRRSSRRRGCRLRGLRGRRHGRRWGRRRRWRRTGQLAADAGGDAGAPSGRCRRGRRRNHRSTNAPSSVVRVLQFFSWKGYFAATSSSRSMPRPGRLGSLAKPRS